MVLFVAQLLNLIFPIEICYHITFTGQITSNLDQPKCYNWIIKWSLYMFEMPNILDKFIVHISALTPNKLDRWIEESF